MYDCLQSRTRLPQIACSFCCDTYQTTSHDGSQNVTVKVGEGLESEMGEGPEPIAAAAPLTTLRHPATPAGTIGISGTRG